MSYSGIKKPSRRYLRFIIDGVVYEFLALVSKQTGNDSLYSNFWKYILLCFQPMGLTSSPRIFTRLTKFLTAIFRRHGIDVVLYLDE